MAVSVRRRSSVTLTDAQSPTTRHVKEYVRRVSSKQLLVFPNWDLTVSTMRVCISLYNLNAIRGYKPEFDPKFVRHFVLYPSPDLGYDIK